MTRPPLELNVDVTTNDGAHFRWGANEPPDSRPQSMSFRTKIGEGFSDASLALPRRIDQDYPDLRLVSDVALVGVDGTVAYEGRLSAMPHELGDAHSISVTLAGWISHAKDRKFSELYIDRDLSGWGPTSRGRRYNLMLANYQIVDPSGAIDPTDSTAGIKTGVQGAWVSPFNLLSEAWYDAGPGVLIGQVAYSWQRSGALGTSPFEWSVHLSTDDKATSTQTSGVLTATGPGSGTLIATAAYRYASLTLNTTSPPGGADGGEYGLDWYKLAVYGSHGLTTHIGETGEPPGVYASDVIRNIVKRWCPRLSSEGVQDTDYVIQHLAFKDRVFPYDALLEINKFHLWHLGVWENKTLVFRSYDLTNYKWEIRTDDPGVQISLQGDSVEDVYNGVVVSYTDLLTGVKAVLTPDDFTDLKDTDPNNPWNQQGIDHWDELELSTPTLAGQARKIGQARLTQANIPKAPGTITINSYVRDRAGSWEPAWKVRAGDAIVVSNFPNDRPRLIHETSWNDDTKTLTVTVEAPAQQLDAVLDRLANALQAKGLS